jgi:hypothetical protein
MLNGQFDKVLNSHLAFNLNLQKLIQNGCP